MIHPGVNFPTARIPVKLDDNSTGPLLTQIEASKNNQAEAFALADQVGVLEGGRLVQAGTPEEIYTRPATPFVARFTGPAGEPRLDPAGCHLLPADQ